MKYRRKTIPLIRYSRKKTCPWSLEISWHRIILFRVSSIENKLVFFPYVIFTKENILDRWAKGGGGQNAESNVLLFSEANTKTEWERSSRIFFSILSWHTIRCIFYFIKNGLFNFNDRKVRIVNKEILLFHFFDSFLFPADVLLVLK